MATVGDADGAAHAEAALGEVQSVAHRGADAVIIAPEQVGGVDAALKDEVLHETTDLVIGKRGDDRGAQAEGAAKAAGNVVLTAAFPGSELTGGADTPLARIEAEHDLAE